MKKYRWHKLNINISIDKLIKNIEEKSYSEKIGEGFRLSNVRAKYFVASYIERIEYKEEYLRPDGTVFEQQYLTYQQTKFEIDYKSNLIEVHLPSRRHGVLLNKLNEVSGFKLIIEDVVVNPMMWLEKIERVFNKKMILGQAVFETVQLKNDIVGDIKLNCDLDLRDNLDVIGGLKKCSPRKIFVRSDKDVKRTSFILASNAVVEHGDALGADAKSHFKAALIDLI